MLLLACTPGASAQSSIIEQGATWRYSDTGPQTGTAWRTPAFDDSAWASGPAQLGYGDGDEATVVGFGPSSSSKYITTYFRKHFDVTDPASLPELLVEVIRDDGAVVYLNGVEVFRTNMGTGSVTSSTLASGASGADETTKFYSQVIPGSLLVAGDNVVAVEVHQDSASSSDISFDLKLSTVVPALVPKGSAWKYLDTGVDPGAGWLDGSFDDTTWLEGRAQLGYGDGDEVTTVGFVDTDVVTAGTQKNITTWFRRKFNVADPAAVEGLQMELLRDDGAVVYLNGTEVLRSAMPAGAVTATTPANASANAGQEASTYVTGTVSPSLLLTGENVIAVEVHQDSNTSADLSFDLRLVNTAPALVRGPYLNRASPTEVTVRWRTDAATDSVVRWGTVEGTLDQVVTDAAQTTEHIVRITGLAPETRYWYSIGRTGVTLVSGAQYYFDTHPPGGVVRPFRFWVLGDSGTGNSTARAVRDAFVTFNGTANTDLLLLLGDNAYNSGLDSEFQANFFEMYPDTLRNTVVWPTLGNHEGMNADSPTETGPYYGNFTMPTAAEAGGMPSGVKAYYSFDYANVHFICLDSQDTPRATTGAMAQWLIADLDATNQEWIVAFWHHPPYTKGTHDSDSASDSSGRMIQMREQILPILESRGVDIVLNGHSHTYERTKFLNGHYGYSSSFSDALHVVQPGDGDPAGDGPYIKVVGPNAGAVYTLTGSAGQSGNSYGLGHPAMVKALAQAGSVVIDVNNKQLDVKFIHSSGEVRDSFQVVHQVPPVAQDSVATITEDTPGPVTLEAADENGDALSAVIVSPPAHGTLTGTFPTLTYTPAADWNGADSFTWKANDGRADSNVVTVTITVSAVPDAPVATAQTLLTPPETPVNITLDGTDADGDALTFAISTPPASGALSGTLPNLVFTPDPGSPDTVTFSFTASDGTLTSAAGTITVYVDSVPEVAPRSISTNEDTAAEAITLTGTDAENHALTFSIVAPPAHGTLSGTLPEVNYTPAANYHGPDSFTYRAFDGFGYSLPAAVGVTVLPVNDAPAALPLTLSGPPPLAVTLGGTDVDGDPLSYSIVAPPAVGSLSGTAPNLVFTPPAEFLGSVEFSYVVNDGTVDSAPALVSITIENAPPVVSAAVIETNEDTAAAPVTLSGTDANSHALNFAIITPPAHGTLSGTLPEVIYTPGPDYHGPDSFSYKANDGLADSAPAVVSVTVLPVNDAPVAQPQTLSGPPPVNITLTGADTDGDPLTFTVVSPPESGTLSGTAPNLVFTPTPAFLGTVEFTFTTNDGTADSAPAIVSLTVENASPVVADRNLETSEDTAGSVTLTGTDVNEQPLTFSIVTPPTHGTLSGTLPEVIYTPEPDYHGPDSFSYKANDGLADSAPAVVSITVLPVNDAPVPASLTPSTNEDVLVALDLTATDADGDALTYAIIEAPVHGILSGTAPALTYTPATDFHGTDSFRYTVSDGTVTSAPQTVVITVLPVNDPPAANPLTFSSGPPLQFSLTASDVEGDALTWSIVSPPVGGILSGTAPDLTFQPDAAFTGAVSFTFKVNDGTADSVPATVELTVENVPPDVSARALEVVEDTAAALTLSGTDANAHPLTFAIVTPPVHGSLSGVLPEVIYTPDANYYGPDSFSYKANDGITDSTPALVSINVSPVNDPPGAEGQSIETDEDTPVSLSLDGEDADGDALTFTVATPPANGTLSGTAPNLIYTPAPDFHGEDSFSFTVSDGSAASTPATVSITVLPLNDAPIASGRAVSTPEDTAVTFVADASDIDGDPLAFSILSPPAHGVLSQTAGEFTYTPDENYAGPDSFTWQVSDGTTAASATVSLTVTPVNDAPVTDFDVYSTTEDTPLSVSTTKRVLRNDSDLHDGAAGENNGPLTAVLVIPPSHAASFALNPNGTFSYTPKPNFHGMDGFTYSAVDALGAASEPETVLVSVWAVNDAPVAADQALHTLEDVPVAVTLRSADVDLLITFDPNQWIGIPPPNTGAAPHDADPIYTIVTPPAHGALSGTAPNLVYTPAADFHGTDTFTFTTSDGLAVSNTATVTITIAPDSDGDALPDAWEMSAFAALTFTGADDPDGDGQDNTFELVAGNDPSDANSCLCMEPASPSPTGGVFRLNRVQPGVLYRLQASLDLQAWDTLSESTYSIEGPGAIHDNRSGGSRRCYYRVTVEGQ